MEIQKTIKEQRKKLGNKIIEFSLDYEIKETIFTNFKIKAS